MSLWSRLAKRKKLTSLLLSVALFFLLATQLIKQPTELQPSMSNNNNNNNEKLSVISNEPSNRTSATSRIESGQTSTNHFKPKLLLTNRMIDLLQWRQEPRELREALQVNSSRVLSLTNVTFPIEPRGFGERRSTELRCPQPLARKGPKLLIVVNSKWNNHERRRQLRSSWLNPANLDKILCDNHHHHHHQRDLKGKQRAARGKKTAISGIDYVFALGRPRQEDDSSTQPQPNQTAAAAAERLNEEAQQFGDLLVINLYENYRTMSVKHLSIFKWLLRRRNVQTNNSATGGDEDFSEDLEAEHILVLKCDDDAHVDLGQLIEFSSNEHRRVGAPRGATGEDPDWIMCARFPPNTQVFRPPDEGKKWQLTGREYPFDTFPGYCSGLAYLAPLRLLRRLYGLAHVLLLQQPGGGDDFGRPLWVDDVFVTGILLESMADRPRIISANAHYCYTRAQQSRRAELNSPCMVYESV